MVGVRRRSAVNYAEPGDESDLGLEEEVHSEEELDEESEEDEPVQVKRAPRQRKRRAAEALPEMAGDANLLNAVRSEGAAIEMAAKDWVDRYQGDRAAATAEALTFLLQACGLLSQAVTAEEAEHSSADDIKAEADAAAQEHGLEEVLGGRSAAARHLRASYREMWDKLVREASAAGILGGGFFLDKVTNLVIALNTSVVRELRRTATVTASQLATSLLHVVVTLEQGRDMAAGQAAAEEGAKGGRERAAAFARQVQQATAAIADLLAYVDSIFQSVFMNRFRDVDPDIRLAVVEGIGRWMRLVPATFLTPAYLKYIAWAVSDKDAGVRLEAATALGSLYADAANAGSLREFTDRFAERFQELMEDREDAVAVAGVKLVTRLVRLNHLPATVGSQVVRLMSDSSPALRAAAADLAAGMLKDLGKEALDAAGRAKRGGGARRGRGSAGGAAGGASAHSEVAWELAGVLRVLRMLSAEEAAGIDADGAPAPPLPEAEAPPLREGAVELVVGSLAPRVAALRNWTLMVEWLKSGTGADVFGAGATEDLLHVLQSALRCATAPPAGPAAGRGREKAAAARARAAQDATLALRDDLLALIRKAQADPSQAAAAVALVPLLKLSVFSLRGEERTLTAALGGVKNVFFMHGDAAPVRAAAAALAHCAAEGPDTTKDAARGVLAETTAAVASELAKAAGALEGAGREALAAASAAFRDTDGEEEAAVLFSARAAVARGAALAAVCPRAVAEAPGDAQESLSRVLELAAAGVDLPAPVVGPAAAAALLLLAFDLSQLNAEGPDLEALGRLSAAQATLSSQLEAALTKAQARGDGDAVRGLAAAQADLITVFSAGNLPEAQQEAAYRPSDAAVTALWRGVEAAMAAGPPTPEPAGGAAAQGLPPATAVQFVARLAASASVPQYRQLAAQLLSYWEAEEAPEVGEVAKDVVRQLKATDVAGLPAVFLGALQACYGRCKAAAAAALAGADATDEELAAAEEEYLQPFIDLSVKIANSQAAFGQLEPVAGYIAREGARWALEGGDERMDFLQGTSFFMVKLKGAAAAAALREVVAAGAAAGAPERPDADAEDEAQGYGEWDLYYQYCEALQDNAAKPTGGRARKGRAKPAVAGGGASGRRISFAPGAAGSDSEEEEAPAAPPAASGRKPAAKKKAAPKKAAAAAAEEAPRRRSSGRASAPVNLAEPEEEDNMDDAGWEEDGGSEEEEEGAAAGPDGGDGGEEFDDAGIIGTEEMLPGMVRKIPGQPTQRVDLREDSDGSGSDDIEEEEAAGQVARRRRRRR